MNFADAIKNEQKWTLTENGAVALNTTSDALLDLFSTVGALRQRKAVEVETMVEEAYKEDPLNTVKCLFYARDIREGLGERDTFRIALRYLANNHSEAVSENIALIGEYGRWDDIYCLVGTPCENKMWAVVYEQFRNDIGNMNMEKPISLLAKWLKSVDTSSEESKRLGRLTAEKLGMVNGETGWKKYTPYRFYLRTLRSYIKVVEKKMCSNEWGEIKYDEVPSRAAMLYREAFKKHDEERYDEFINKVNNGEAKINASTLYPYDIINKYLTGDYWDGYWSDEEDATIEALWKNLPNYVAPNTNAVIIADTSDSMYSNSKKIPMCSAVGLAIYFAERNIGAYHNLWMNFSSSPSWQKLKGSSLIQKLHSLNMRNWNGSTNLHSAFMLVLDTAVKNHISQDEMPKSIVVISDMEIDFCGDRDWSFYDQMKAEFAQYGYDIPQVIFWNVNSMSNVFHADSSRKGVVLCSGHSTTTFKNLINSIGMTPVEYMMSVLNGKRYEAVKIA